MQWIISKPWILQPTPSENRLKSIADRQHLIHAKKLSSKALSTVPDPRKSCPETRLCLALKNRHQRDNLPTVP